MRTSDRALIAKIARESRIGLIDVERAAKALNVSRRAAAMKLAALARRGWIVRARRGLYLLLPLEADPGRAAVAEDPWVLAREVFAPCYIGGWSAAEHWGLTEQLFRSILVITAAHVRSHSVRLLGQEFRLFRVSQERIETDGVTLVWRSTERVPVSSRERTVVDCLRYPQLCGGVRHLADMMREYGNNSEHDFKKLVATAEKAANGAAWKRLGYLAELVWPSEKWMAEEVRKHLTTGNVALDPSVKRRGKLLRRWGLLVNVPITAEKNQS